MQAHAAGARLTDPVGVTRCTHFSGCVWAHTVALWASECARALGGASAGTPSPRYAGGPVAGSLRAGFRSPARQDVGGWLGRRGLAVNRPVGAQRDRLGTDRLTVGRGVLCSMSRRPRAGHPGQHGQAAAVSASARGIKFSMVCVLCAVWPALGRRRRALAVSRAPPGPPCGVFAQAETGSIFCRTPFFFGQGISLQPSLLFTKRYHGTLLNLAFLVQNSLVPPSGSLGLYSAKVNPTGTEFTRPISTVLTRAKSKCCCSIWKRKGPGQNQFQ